VTGRVAARIALLVVSAWLAKPTVAHAEPEWNTGFSLGAAGVGEHRVWSDTKFFGALHGDLLFGRTTRRDVGIGPSAEIATLGFDDARLMGGVTALVPVGDLLALGLTPGAYLRTGAGNATGGWSARGFFGARTFNSYGSYSLAAGLVFGFDQDVGAHKEHALVVAAQIDGFVLALPVILLVGWLKGPDR
jgi:hypothetical protein